MNWTALLIAAAVWLFLMLPVYAICTMSRRADERDEARRRHPANYWNWSPRASAGTHSGIDHTYWSDDTEAAIEQAVDIFDDGKRLVAEVEAHLREVSR